MMDNFEWNKIAASVLLALIVVKGSELISKKVIHADKPLKKGYFVDVKSSSNVVGAKKGLAPIAPFIEKADVKNGERIFKAKCSQCHVINDSGKHGALGPNLLGVVGRGIASAASYAYSSAFKKKKEMNWSNDNLSSYLHKPAKFIRGTKMSFAGLRKDQDRGDIIAFLHKNSK
jgi:cytochrome c